MLEDVISIPPVAPVLFLPMRPHGCGIDAFSGLTALTSLYCFLSPVLLLSAVPCSDRNYVVHPS